MDYNLIVRQSNNFIESAFAQEYSEQEIKTMEYIISMTNKNDIELFQRNELKEIKVSVDNFARLIGANPKQIYRDAKSLCASLVKKQYHFQWIDDSGKKAFETGVFLTSMRYADGIIQLKINPTILPYFIEINEKFTEFNLRHIIAIGSSYGVKLYKLLKQYQKINKRELTINELRRQFGIDENKYSLYSNFKNKVIDIACKHINEHTDILVRYEELKTSRKVTALYFYIQPKDNQEKQAKILFIQWVNEESKVINLKKNTVKNIIDICVKNNKDYMKEKEVKEAWDYFIFNYVCNYDPTSCKELQIYEKDTLFRNHE